MNCPDGWKPMELKEIGDWQTGNTPRRSNSEYWGGSILWVSPKDMKTGRITDTQDKMTEKALEETNSRIIPEGSIIMVTRSSILEHSLPVAINKNPVTINQDLKALIPSDEVLAEFLYYNIVSKSKDILRECSKDGTTVASINSNLLYEYELPIAPKELQRRVVDKINELFSMRNAGQEELQEAKDTLEKYRSSVLKNAVHGRLTSEWRSNHDEELEDVSSLIERHKSENEDEIELRRGVPEEVNNREEVNENKFPDCWKCVSVASLLRHGLLIDLKDGNHGSNHPKQDEFTEDGLPFITAEMVSDFKIDYQSAPKLKGEPLEKLKVGFAEAGDVLLTHKGSVGRVGFNDRECVCSPQTTYYRPDQKILNRRYLAYALSSYFFQKQLGRVKTQTTRDYVSISKQYRLFLPIPPIPEQKEIASRLDPMFSNYFKIKESIEDELSRSAKLPDTILKKAFTGELVTSNSESGLDTLNKKGQLTLEEVAKDAK